MSRSKVKVTADKKKLKSAAFLFGSRPLGRGPSAEIFFWSSPRGRGPLRRWENQRMLSSRIHSSMTQLGLAYVTV